MRDLNFEQADEVYGCSDSHNVITHLVSHEAARRFALQLRELERTLDQQREDPYWVNVLRPFRRYRFNTAFLPLEFNHPLCVPGNLKQIASDGAKTCSHVFPQFAGDLERLTQSALRLLDCADAPLLDALRALLDRDPHAKRAVLLRSSIGVAVCNHIRTYVEDDALECLTPSALQSAGTFTQILLMGPFGWFPESVISAPRGRTLISVRFDWLGDRHELAPSFVCSPDARSVFPSPHREYVPQPDLMQNDLQLRPEEVAPPINWNEIGAEIARQAPPSDHEEELPARLLILAGHSALYLDVSAGATAQVINLAGQSRVDRIRVDELEPGMYILVRTSGGGNLVTVVADLILKDRARDVRALQEKWKSALRSHVSSRGEDAVQRDLVRLGCKRASYQNVRNWMSTKSIRPEFDEDFRSILTLCGFDNDEHSVFANAKLLDRVHRLAGFKIRQMLLKEVSKADWQRLIRDGLMGFELPRAEGGSFTAYRVEDIDPEVKNVSEAQTRHPFNVGMLHG